jgi:hypothetical protein
MRSIFTYAAAGLISLGLVGLMPERSAAGPVPVYSYNYFPARFTTPTWVPATGMQPFTTFNQFPLVSGTSYGPDGAWSYSYTPPLRYYYPASTYYNPTLTANYMPPATGYYSNPTGASGNPTSQGTPAYTNTTGQTYYYNTGR